MSQPGNLSSASASTAESSVESFRKYLCCDAFALNSLKAINSSFSPESSGSRKPKYDFETDKLREPSAQEKIQKCINKKITAKLEKSVARDVKNIDDDISYENLIDDFERRWAGQVEYIGATSASLEKNAYIQEKNCVNAALRESVKLRVKRRKRKLEKVSHSLRNDSMLLSIRVYDTWRQNAEGRVLQEYLVQGMTTLYDFCSAVFCQQKLSYSLRCDSQATEQYLSGAQVDNEFLFIGNVFYCSGSFAKLRAKQLSQWIADSGTGASNPTVIDMADVAFEQLAKLKLGKRYLYSHNYCSCEHSIVVENVQRYHPSLPRDPNSYPYPTFQRRLKRYKCGICELVSARYTCYNNPISPEGLGLYCDRCVRSLLYTNSSNLNSFGRKAALKLFPYFHQ
uniref:snRNA-activating protein complex subunit 3 n=1 Tax=Aplanochytrium stocchinoi TaxID=215587 RepID=A0A7S3V265_9STRA|mmetsp:Transcript_15919/g.19744  ORF Transcript_15919/g.19744 Transcript_15919/m.19744 type:complete len:397 (+) Transcript_15919:127-1317(+)